MEFIEVKISYRIKGIRKERRRSKKNQKKQKVQSIHDDIPSPLTPSFFSLQDHLPPFAFTYQG
jgi:hypothetical protein